MCQIAKICFQFRVMVLQLLSQIHDTRQIQASLLLNFRYNDDVIDGVIIIILIFI